MKALIQRVSSASVSIDNQIYSQINKGMLIFLGVEKTDELLNAKKLAEKLVALRIFDDGNGKMNKSLMDVGGEILVVSQFTLLGDCKKGTRPCFDKAAPINKARELYEEFVNLIAKYGLVTKSGKFQAMMNVSIVNDGPVTFLVEK